MTTLPVAPGEYQHLPSPPMVESIVRRPCSSDVRMFETPILYMSW